jgi:hypothetical protein
MTQLMKTYTTPVFQCNIMGPRHDIEFEEMCKSSIEDDKKKSSKPSRKVTMADLLERPTTRESNSSRSNKGGSGYIGFQHEYGPKKFIKP